MDLYTQERKDCWKKGEGENDENKVPNCFQQHKKNERTRNESRSGWSSAFEQISSNVTCLCKSINQTLALKCIEAFWLNCFLTAHYRGESYLGRNLAFEQKFF